MGQCGCSDTEPDFQFPGPDGITYAIQIYPSCHYCNTPAGVDVYRMTAEDVEIWLNGVEQAPFVPYSADNPSSAQLAIPVLDPASLAKVLNEDVDQDLALVREDEIRLALRQAVWQTLKDWRELVRRAEAAS